MTYPNTLELPIGEGALHILPSVHFSVPFAEAANAFFCDPETRPDVVAVELSPAAAAALVCWLQELGIAPNQRRRLPCMLGLLERGATRSTAPAASIKADRSDFSSVRVEELGAEFSASTKTETARSLLLISPTDSIVEAVRCALELDIPVIGVDAENHPPVRAGSVVLPDPASASGRVLDYVNDHASLAQIDPDPEVNGPREQIMAARLKKLAAGGRKVFFTCGLAHWQRIVALTQQPGLPVAVFPPSKIGVRDNGFRRVLVSPEIGWQGIDRAPLTGWLYERRRRHPRLDCGKPETLPMPLGQVLHSKLRQTVNHYLYRMAKDRSHGRIMTSQAIAIKSFPSALSTYQRYALRHIPDLASAYACAASFIGSDFANALAESFMRFPWARPEAFPSLAVLEHAPRGARPGSVRLTDRGRYGKSFLISTVGLDATTPRFASAHQSKKHGETSPNRWMGGMLTWEPWENLVMASCDTAIRKAGNIQRKPVAEPLQQSLEDGLDIRASIRAWSRGDDRLYVHRRTQKVDHAPMPITFGWPVVWIFDASQAKGCSWQNCLLPLSWLADHARDEVGFKRRYMAQANNLCAMIGYSRLKPEDPSSEVSVSIQQYHMHGALLFAPPFTTNRQYARWLERCNVGTTPLYRQLGLLGLPDVVIERTQEGLQARLGMLRWQDDIVAMAIPFSQQNVTVIAPRTFRLSSRVYQAAARIKRRIVVLPLEGFTPSDVARIRENFLVPGRSTGGEDRVIYDARAVEKLGESREQFRGRVPYRWRNFGL